MNPLSNSKWTITRGEPGLPQATVRFTYDPSQVPPNVIGGTGSIETSGPGGSNDKMVWVQNGSNFLFQLLNQDPAVETKTTYSGTVNGDSGTGSFCNFEINFATGTFTMRNAD